jgi:hypothetical protein
MDLRERRETKSLSGIRHPWELARLHIVKWLLRAHLGGEPPALVLDIGCGDAFVVGQLARHWPTTGFLAVDTALDETLLESLRTSFPDANVSFCRTLEEAEAGARRAADVVLLLDVIEHIEDDIGFLDRLRQSALTADSTSFLITVPAWQRLHSAHDVFLGHFRRYDSGVLQQHLAQAGFQVEETGHFFVIGLLLRWLKVARERRLGERAGKSVGLAAWRGGPWFTWIVARLLIFDFACSRMFRSLGIRLPGLSQYALCKRLVS